MKKHYEYMVGRTVQFVFDQSDSDHEKLKIQFTDGSHIIIMGSASGNDVWYEGLYYKFEENPSKCPRGQEWDDCPDCGH